MCVYVCVAYLHIVMTEVFDSRTVPLKWNFIQLFQWDVVLFKDAGDCRYADTVDANEGYLICDDLLSQITKLDFVICQKILTMATSCSSLNIACLPPCAGCLAVL